MAERDFFDPAAKERVTSTVRAVEALTSLELVVAVRRRAAFHVVTCLVAGLVVATLAFAWMWWSPQAYDVVTMPLDAALAFALGAGLVASVPALRRVLTPRAARERATERTARRVFSELGVERTRDRSGLLVLVAVLERSVALVADSGVPAELLEARLAPLRARLEQAVARLDFEAFLGALSELGPAAAAALPRRHDDVNELCDDVA
jgi:putative membrane protein